MKTFVQNEQTDLGDRTHVPKHLWQWFIHVTLPNAPVPQELKGFNDQKPQRRVRKPQHGVDFPDGQVVDVGLRGRDVLHVATDKQKEYEEDGKSGVGFAGGLHFVPFVGAKDGAPRTDRGRLGLAGGFPGVDEFASGGFPIHEKDVDGTLAFDDFNHFKQLADKTQPQNHSKGVVVVEGQPVQTVVGQHAVDRGGDFVKEEPVDAHGKQIPKHHGRPRGKQIQKQRGDEIRIE